MLALEFVSKTYGAEYEAKQTEYAQIGVLYYAIYNPDYYNRDQHQLFEVYRLVAGKYELQAGNPVWLPEIGLGIGTGQGIYRAWEREWLYWYDNQGNRLSAPEEVAQQERQRADRLANQLRQMGIDPDWLWSDRDVLFPKTNYQSIPQHPAHLNLGGKP